MKNITIIALLLMTTQLLNSQDYMQDIVQKSCECITELTDSLKTNAAAMELGLCMIESAMPYQEELLEDYDIDLKRIDGHQGEELGRIIGLEMVSVCPEVLMAVAGDMENEAEEIESSFKFVEGEVISISEDKFVEFSIKDESGKVSKYYWLTFAASNIELPTDYNSLVEKSVQVGFITQDFFDARIGEYRPFYVISSLNVIEE